MTVWGRTEIDNGRDLIDSREVMERIRWLEIDEPDPDSGDSDAGDSDAGDGGAGDSSSEWGDREELLALRALEEEAGGCEDWAYGATLIRDSYFVTYAQDYASDIGAIPDSVGWPCTCIDWDQAARELQMDYTSVEFSGVTYWVRS